MSKSEFEELVGEVLVSLPQEFQEKLDNVVVTVEDWPTLVQITKLRIPHGVTLFGLYEGIPKTQRTNYHFVPPDRITIFQKPIEWFRRDLESIKAQVRQTVLHEIGHYFGLSEEKLTKT